MKEYAIYYRRYDVNKRERNYTSKRFKNVEDAKHYAARKRTSGALFVKIFSFEKQGQTTICEEVK